jgi:hypothetical protein
VLLTASAGLAQAGRAEIRGTVFDEAKAVLPGATITVADEGTGLTRTVTSSNEGTYVIPTLLPGRCTIRAELSGFREITRMGLVLNVGQELTVNLTLPLAGLSEAVTVCGEAPLVEATVSRIGTNITNAEIDNLPAAGRSQLSLITLRASAT